ncbi:MAG: hypothetical protein ACKN9T_03060 [Candidatus Methylumidiphilus sp.]
MNRSMILRSIKEFAISVLVLAAASVCGMIDSGNDKKSRTQPEQDEGWS